MWGNKPTQLQPADSWQGNQKECIGEETDGSTYGSSTYGSVESGYPERSETRFLSLTLYKTQPQRYDLNVRAASLKYLPSDGRSYR